MRHEYLDRYSRLRSPIHSLPAGLKFAAALAAVVAVVLVPSTRTGWLALIGAVLITVAALSRIPWRFLVLRLVLLEPFVLGVAILALFQPGGWHRFLFLVARGSLCLLAMVLLANTTPFSGLLRVLKAVGVPSLLLTTLSLMYRYLFVVVDQAQRMKRARLSRTFSPRRTRTWRALSSVVGQLFIRTTERAERVYGAMCARGLR